MRSLRYIDLRPTEFEKIEVSSANAVGLTANKYTGRVGAYITVESNNLRYRIDGTAPDANTGHLVYANQSIYFRHPSSIANLSMIATTGNSTIQVTYYN